MHFVHVEDFFHPDAGYQVNLLSRLQVLQGHRVTIVTAELERMPNGKVLNIINRLPGYKAGRLTATESD